MGTPAYMAPEQARGRWGDVDERTDLWAVGATAYALLSGHLVHEAETANEVLGKAMTERAQPIAELVPDLPTSIAALVDRALSYHKRDRFGSAHEMREALTLATRDLDLVPPTFSIPSGAELRAEPYASTIHALRVSGSRLTRDLRLYGFPFAVVVSVGAAVLAVSLTWRRQPAPSPSGMPIANSEPQPRTAEREPVIEPAATEPPMPSTGPSAPVVAPRGRQLPSASAPAASAPSPPASDPTPSRSSRCDPPFYLDARGIKHFRPECL